MKSLMPFILRILRITGFYIEAFPFEKPNRTFRIFHIAYCVLSNLLLLFNTGRYLTIFHGESRINGSLMSSLAILFFWLEATFTSVALSVSLPGNLQKFYLAVTEHKEKMGSDDHYLKKIRKVMISISVCSCIAFPFLMIPLSGTVERILPSMVRHTTPFNLLKGRARVVAMVFYCFLLTLDGLHLFSSMTLFLLTSVCISKEFATLNGKFQHLVKNTESEEPHSRASRERQNGSLELVPMGTEESECLSDTKASKLHDTPNDRLHHLHAETIFSMPGSRDSFETLVEWHQRVCGMVTVANEFLSHIIVAAYVFTIPQMCFLIYGLVKGELHIDEWIFCSICIAMSFATLLGVTIVAIVVNDKAHEPLQILVRGNWPTSAMRQKVSFFIQRLTAEKIGYSVYGTFVIDSSSFLMVFGTLLTYAVVVLQINPGSGNDACNIKRLTFNITSALNETLNT